MTYPRNRARDNARAQYYGQDWPRQPIPVFCDGWTSDTLTLQRHGYEFKTYRNEQRLTWDILIGKAGCRSVISIPDFHYEESYLHNPTGRPLEFHGEFITRMEVREEIQQLAATWKTVDMNDAYWCEREVMYSNGHFHLDPRDLFPQSEKTESGLIILPNEQTVTEALDVLLTMQAPRAEEIKDRNRKRAGKEHARIITLEEVA
jgi:hypothetical protein